MAQSKSLTTYFGTSLARLLAKKIVAVYPAFHSDAFIADCKKGMPQTLMTRVEHIAHALARHLPQEYPAAVAMLVKIIGPENPKETGMFTEYYWLMPVGKFIELYGLRHVRVSLDAIEEITKRNTGEYAIRPFIRKYPKQTLTRMQRWSRSKNFHLRRLASEGLRPKLPWAQKLDVFIDDPTPVFHILERLKTDPVRFVQKSVANNIRDYRKVNPAAAVRLLKQWERSKHDHTVWIVRHAMR